MIYYYSREQLQNVQITVFLPLFHQQLKTLPKHSSMESLMVETVLESFDFLNTDCSADELSLFGSIRTGSVRFVLQLLVRTSKGGQGNSWGVKARAEISPRGFRECCKGN